MINKRCMKELPSYAAPLLLRIRREMDITTTFKHKKNTLIEEGFNPATVKVKRIITIFTCNNDVGANLLQRR
jgi:hypothetical protein